MDKKFIKNILSAYNLVPKKSLGQNFLINPKIYKDIVMTAEIKEGDNVLEIGAGLGTLTDNIAKAVGETGRVIGIEKDDNFAKILSDRFAGQKNVKIINADILKFRISDLGFRIFDYKVIGNIPYYLTSRLLREIFDPLASGWPRPELIVLMVQREVAQRIMAGPPKSNLLAVSVQYFSKPQIIRLVGKTSFWPRPEIDSAIIKLKPNHKLRITNYENLFFKTVRAGFGGKRKQLCNSLAHGLKISKQSVKKILKSAGIDPARRAETLTISEWEKITKIYFHAK